MNVNLYRPQFNKMDPTEKQALMESLAVRYDMAFFGLHTFERWGQSCTTGVFEKDGREFVFVPGDTVTLGWERFAVGLNEESREELEYLFQEWEEDQEPEELIKESMAPVRQAPIGPMLAGRELEELCWEPVQLDDPRLTAHPDWLKEFRDFAWSDSSSLTIGPMLAGRELEELCWEPVQLDDPRLTAHPDWLKEFRDFAWSDSSSLTLHQSARMERTEDGFQTWIYHRTEYEALLDQLKKQGLSLPTADEWAYLCGGGCRTLFPWGDGLDYSMRLHWFEDMEEDGDRQGLSLPTADEWAYLCGGGCRTLFPWGDGLDYSMRLHWFEDMEEDGDRPYDMEEPNFFGLSIAYDPYMREVVQADGFTTCGGDGGCSICGGLGPFLGFLPCSPHCKPEVQEDNELNGDYDFYRPVIRVESV